MKIYTTRDSVEELDSFPRSERKAIWATAWKEMRKKEKGIWSYPLFTALVCFLIMLSLMLVPPILVNSAVAGGIAGWATQQFYFRKVIPFITK